MQVSLDYATSSPLGWTYKLIGYVQETIPGLFFLPSFCHTRYNYQNKYVLLATLGSDHTVGNSESRSGQEM